MGRRRLRLPLAGALALLCTAGVAAQVEEGAPAFGNATAQWLASGSRALLQAPGDAACAGGIRNGRICCPGGDRCTVCGGGSCSVQPGGQDCCVMGVLRVRRSCASHPPPCVLPPTGRSSRRSRSGSGGAAAAAGAGDDEAAASERGSGAPETPYEFMAARLEMDGEPGPQCTSQYHRLSYVIEKQRAIAADESCRPWGAAAAAAPAATAPLRPHGPLLSSVRCSLQRDGVTENYCEVANVAINLERFRAYSAPDDGLPPREHMPEYATNQDPRGSLGAVCQLDPGKWTRDRFGWAGQYWLWSALEALGDPAAQESPSHPECVAWDYPLYVMGDLYGLGNPWHTLEDVTHTFTAYAIHGLPPSDTQIVVSDARAGYDVLRQMRPYGDLYIQGFSGRGPPVGMIDYMKQFMSLGVGKPNAAVCLRKAAFSVHGGVSILSRSTGEENQCVNSTNIKGLIDYATKTMGLAGVEPDSSRDAKAPLVVTYASRGSGVQDHGSGREIQGEGDILKGLEEMAARGEIKFRSVDFGALVPLEQFRKVRETDLLMGPHGAALTHAFWLPEHRGVIELSKGFRCHCYHNIAVWGGHPYYRMDMSWGGDAQQVLAQVGLALAEVRSRLDRSRG